MQALSERVQGEPEGRTDRVLSDGWDTAGGKSGPTYVGGTMHFRKKGFGRRIFFGM